jgi:hypothetical protein
MLDDHASMVTRFLRVLESTLEGRGVIHVGVHQGQEVDQYLAHACGILRERFKSRVSVVDTNPVLVTSFPL